MTVILWFLDDQGQQVGQGSAKAGYQHYAATTGDEQGKDQPEGGADQQGVLWFHHIALRVSHAGNIFRLGFLVE
ncbi:MAG: hypothetical protein U0931_28595 [Vulcanimicrobiota bacterium]